MYSCSAVQVLTASFVSFGSFGWVAPGIRARGSSGRNPIRGPKSMSPLKLPQPASIMARGSTANGPPIQRLITSQLICDTLRRGFPGIALHVQSGSGTQLQRRVLGYQAGRNG